MKTLLSGEPPAEVIHGESTDMGNNSAQAENGTDIEEADSGNLYEGEILADAVQEAYTSNLDDTWGVDVYFWITKTLK